MVIACFDIGGTQVKSAFISKKKIISQSSINTPQTLEVLLDWMKTTILSQSDVSAISLSVPGAIDYKTGYIRGISAIKYIHEISWYDQFEELGLPIFLENDANCVGLSQMVKQNHPKTFACVVIGTGIGGALIVDNHLVRGKKSYGGEFGYMIINGLSNPIKNWSQLASTGNLVLKVKKVTGDKNWTGKRIFEASKDGNVVCRQAISEMLDNLAIGLLNLFYIFEPECIYIGGGISQNQDFISDLVEKLEKIQEKHSDIFPEIPVVKACDYANDANLMGAFINALRGDK